MATGGDRQLMFSSTASQTSTMSMMILALSMCSLAKHTLNEKDLIDVLRELSPLKTAFPVLVKSIQIALTIAVRIAHREHSFSALKHA